MQEVGGAGGSNRSSSVDCRSDGTRSLGIGWVVLDASASLWLGFKVDEWFRAKGSGVVVLFCIQFRHDSTKRHIPPRALCGCCCWIYNILSDRHKGLADATINTKFLKTNQRNKWENTHGENPNTHAVKRMSVIT